MVQTLHHHKTASQASTLLQSKAKTVLPVVHESAALHLALITESAAIGPGADQEVVVISDSSCCFAVLLDMVDC